MKTISLLCLFVAFPAAKAVFAQTDQKLKVQTVEAVSHDYAPLREVVMEIKDFTFPALDDSNVNLRESARGKKLTLVHYFAAWCHSSNYDVVTLTEIYNKYRDQGLLVIGVCEYSSRNELREFIEKHKPTYPICVEGDGRNRDRTRTTHFAYRKQIDDQRKWGTPVNILIADSDIQKEGEVVAKRVRIAPGEVIKTEFEEIIRRHLGLN
ncbi:MAG: TlpA disulfide reductase family protein [Blastocatellales bacterium]